MAYEISGTVKVVFDTQTFPSGFSKREFVLTTDDKFPQDVKLECLKEKAALLDGVEAGQRVKASFDINGREYNGRYFVNLVAWRLEPESAAGAAAPAGEGDDAPIPEDTGDYSTKDDEIPF